MGKTLSLLQDLRKTRTAALQTHSLPSYSAVTTREVCSLLPCFASFCVKTVLVLILLITGCTTYQQQVIPENLQLENHSINPLSISNPKVNVRQKASSISSWELSGAIAAKTNKKGWSAAINWQQQGLNKYQIRLIGTLAQGNAIIEKHGGTVTYQEGNKKVSSNNADTLLEKHTGIHLPVHNLYYWVRGLAAPGGVASTQYNANQQISAISQSGYTINYLEYVLVGNTYLPSKIQLQGHGTYLKLVIKNWKI